MTRCHPSPNPVYVDPTTGARMKHCPTCGEERNIDQGEFSRRDGVYGAPGQYRFECKACHAARGREYRARLGDEYLERERCRRRRGRRWW
jgi:transposase-like protein